MNKIVKSLEAVRLSINVLGETSDKFKDLESFDAAVVTLVMAERALTGFLVGARLAEDEHLSKEFPNKTKTKTEEFKLN